MVERGSQRLTRLRPRLFAVEPPILERESAKLTEQGTPWHAERLPMLEARIRKRLRDLSNRIGDADWLDATFSAGDLMKVTVLRRLGGSTLLSDLLNLTAYVARAEARLAFKRAFADQLAVFTGSAMKDTPHTGVG